MRQPDPPDPYLPVFGRSGRPHGEPVQPAPRPTRTADATPRLWKLTPAQWVLASGGLLMLLGTFLPWYAVTLVVPGQQQSTIISGWDVPTGKATLLLGMLALALLALQLLNVKLPAMVSDREVLIYLALGVESFLFALLYLLDGPRILTSGGFYTAGTGIGLYLVLAGSIAIAAGGYLRTHDRKSWLL